MFATKLALRGALALLVVVVSLAVPATGGQATRFPGEDREIIRAIVRGDTATVANQIAADPDLAVRLLGDGPRNKRYDPRETGLAIAVRNHRMDVARALLEAGADPGRDGGLNVGLLGRVQFPEMVALLLEHGADPKAFARSLPRGRLGLDRGRSPRVESIYRALVDAGIELEQSALAKLGWSDELRGTGAEGAEADTGRHELLYHALERGDSEMLRSLLAGGVPAVGAPPPAPYSNWGYPSTILQWALFVGSADDALALIGAGALVDLDARGWDSKPGMRMLDSAEWLAEDGDLLDRAIDIGSIELFEALVKSGLHPGRSAVLEGDERSVLLNRMQRAAWRGHSGVLSRLMKAAGEADVELPFERLLLTAGAAGHRELHQSLIELSGSASPHAAAALGDVHTLRGAVAADRDTLRTRDPICDLTPLAWAVITEQSDAVAYLVSSGSEVEAWIDRKVAGARWIGRPGTGMPVPVDEELPLEVEREMKSVTPLEAALLRRSLPIAAQLIAGDAEVKPPALVWLVRDPTPEADMLLRSALDRDLVDRSDAAWARRALSALVVKSSREAGAVERIDLLLAHGGDQSVQGDDEHSIVDAGFRAGASPELLRRFADLGSSVSEGVAVALGWRGEGRARSFVDSLDEKEWESFLHKSSWRPDTEPYKRVFTLRSGVTADQALKQVRRLAHRGRLDLVEIAARKCEDGYELVRDPEVLEHGASFPEFVRDLLARGADPNRTPPDAFGALHHATGDAALESVRLLLEAGASPSTRSFNGRPPLYEVTFAADHMNSPEVEARVLAVIEALLEAGADPLSVDDVGRVTFEQLQYQGWSREGSATLKELLGRHMNPDWL